MSDEVNKELRLTCSLPGRRTDVGIIYCIIWFLDIFLFRNDFLTIFYLIVYKNNDGM